MRLYVGYFEGKTVPMTELRCQQEEARRLDEAIWRNLRELGYGR